MGDLRGTNGGHLGEEQAPDGSALAKGLSLVASAEERLDFDSSVSRFSFSFAFNRIWFGSDFLFLKQICVCWFVCFAIVLLVSFSPLCAPGLLRCCFPDPGNGLAAARFREPDFFGYPCVQMLGAFNVFFFAWLGWASRVFLFLKWVFYTYVFYFPDVSSLLFYVFPAFFL